MLLAAAVLPLAGAPPTRWSPLLLAVVVVLLVLLPLLLSLLLPLLLLLLLMLSFLLLLLVLLLGLLLVLLVLLLLLALPSPLGAAGAGCTAGADSAGWVLGAAATEPSCDSRRAALAALLSWSLNNLSARKLAKATPSWCPGYCLHAKSLRRAWNCKKS